MSCDSVADHAAAKSPNQLSSSPSRFAPISGTRLKPNQYLWSLKLPHWSELFELNNNIASVYSGCQAYLSSTLHILILDFPLRESKS